MTIGIAAAEARRLTLDPVLAALALALGALALVAPEQAAASLGFVGMAGWRIAPFLLLSIAIAAYTRAAGVDQLIGRAFRGRTAAMIVAAALFGALSPFCSCGVIPIIAALLAAGMPLSAVMAFWIASPLMDPQMFILTASELGLGFAAAKTASAAALGLGAGFATLGIERLGLLPAPLRKQVSGCAGGALDAGAAGPRWAFWVEPARRERFARTGAATAWFLGRWLALAFLIESLMVAWLPAQAIGRWLGAESFWAIPAAAFAGVPAYLNGFAAIPTVDALMTLGMAPGAALTFMVAGGVTSVPAAVAVIALVRAPVFAWYIALALVGSISAGLAYQAALTF